MMQQAEHDLHLTKWSRGSLIRRDLALTCLQTLELPIERHLESPWYGPILVGAPLIYHLAPNHQGTRLLFLVWVTVLHHDTGLY